MPDNQAEERVVVYTKGERIEGILFYGASVRLSDSLNSEYARDYPFVKLKDAIITCRRTDREMARPPLALVARSAILLITTDSPPVDHRR